MVWCFIVTMMKKCMQLFLELDIASFYSGMLKKNCLGLNFQDSE